MAQGRYLRVWRHKENVSTQEAGLHWALLSVPKNTHKTAFAVRFLIVTHTWIVSLSVTAPPNTEQEPMTLWVICPILLVFYNLRCSAIRMVWNYAGFHLPSWWSSIYLLGLSWETVRSLSLKKKYSHFARTIFNWGGKKNSSILQGKLLCKNTTSYIIGNPAITSLSLKPAWWEWFLNGASEDFLLKIAFKSELSENHLPTKECECAFILDWRFSVFGKPT